MPVRIIEPVRRNVVRRELSELAAQTTNRYHARRAGGRTTIVLDPDPREFLARVKRKEQAVERERQFFAGNERLTVIYESLHETGMAPVWEFLGVRPFRPARLLFQMEQRPLREIVKRFEEFERIATPTASTMRDKSLKPLQFETVTLHAAGTIRCSRPASPSATLKRSRSSTRSDLPYKWADVAYQNMSLA